MEARLWLSGRLGPVHRNQSGRCVVLPSWLRKGRSRVTCLALYFCFLQSLHRLANGSIGCTGTERLSILPQEKLCLTHHRERCFTRRPNISRKLAQRSTFCGYSRFNLVSLRPGTKESPRQFCSTKIRPKCSMPVSESLVFERMAGTMKKILGRAAKPPSRP